MIKCRECGYKLFKEGNGNPNRYYCSHPEAAFARSECEPTPMICRTGYQGIYQIDGHGTVRRTQSHDALERLKAGNILRPLG